MTTLTSPEAYALYCQLAGRTISQQYWRRLLLLKQIPSRKTSPRRNAPRLVDEADLRTYVAQQQDKNMQGTIQS